MGNTNGAAVVALSGTILSPVLVGRGSGSGSDGDDADFVDTFLLGFFVVDDDDVGGGAGAGRCVR